ncbi:MAG: hypothetical protein ACJ8D1_18560, partial [Microvirga sp.]
MQVGSVFMTAIAAAHLSPDLNGQPAGIEIHIIFRDYGTRSHIAIQADTVREADGQHAPNPAAGGWRQPPIDRVAALALQAFSPLEVAL